jgi:HTH-type transcriptional regulator/antitoxin HigA
MIENSELFTPQCASPPGDTISDLLEEKGWKQSEFAKRTGYTTKHINQLIKGDAAVTETTALILEKVLGSSARFWLTREAQYREALARKKETDQLEADIDWLDELPVNDMIRLGWISKARTKAETVLNCLKFFNVASVAAWRKRCLIEVTAFRASPNVEKKAGAIAAWLCEGERRAAQIACSPFNRNNFQAELQNIRTLTLQRGPREFVPRLVEACAKHGIAVVFLPAPKGCPASGATRWISPEKAMLLLSLRYKSNDALWFTYFHEAGHLLLHGKKLLFLEVTEPPNREDEDKADRFARDILIPPSDARRLRDLGYREEAVEEFAHQIGVAPGIVVGRMQNEKLIPYSHLNSLKIRYRWSNDIGA